MMVTVFAGLVLVFVFCEIYFRKTLDVLVYRDSPDPELRFELIPGAEGVKHNTRVKINSWGFRGPEIERKKPDGAIRIITVGDYYAFGSGVAQQEIFAYRLNKIFEKNGSPVESFAMGMEQYTIKQKIACIKRLALKFNPDILVLQVFDDDLDSLIDPFLNLPRLKNFIRSNFAAVRWLTEKIFWYLQMHQEEDEEELPIEDIENSFRELKALSQEKHFRVLVVFFPNYLNTDYEKINIIEGAFKSCSGQNGFRYINLKNELDSAGGKSLLTNQEFPHLSAKAHGAASGALSKVLKANYLK